MPGHFSSVIELKNPDTGRSGIIFGNIHYAGSDYMHELEARLLDSELGGATVFYEGVRHNTEAEIAAAPHEQQESYKGFELVLSLTKLIAENDGRRRLFSPKDTWINSDVTLLDAAGSMSRREVFFWKALCGLLDEYVTTEVVDDTDSEKESKYGPQHETGYQFGRGLGVAIGRSIVRQLTPSIVDMRNEHALDIVHAAMSAGRAKDIALLWGEGHVKGLTKGLKARGYRVTDVDYIDSRF